VLGTNPKYDWKRFGRLSSRLGQISPAAFERCATEEGVDPVQNRSERGFAQAPHPSSRSLKDERTTTSDQHSETVDSIGSGPLTTRNVLPCGERDMATTATLADREAEELRPALGRRRNGAWQSVSLSVGRLMSCSTNCDGHGVGRRVDDRHPLHQSSTRAETVPRSFGAQSRVERTC
jgi:hypothetical protein